MKIPKIRLQVARQGSNKSVLTLRVNLNNERLSVSSGISVKVKNWNQSLMRVHNRDNEANVINAKIIAYQRMVEDAMIKLESKNRLNIRNLKNYLKSENQENIKGYDPSNYLDLFELEYLPRNPHLKPSTITTYRTTSTALKGYFNPRHPDKVKHISIHDLNNMDFYNDFLIYQFDDVGNGKNGADKHIKHIIMILNYAGKKGYLNDFEFKDFKRISEFSPRIHLDMVELERINKCELISEELDTARDWLLIGCWTAFRSSDLLNITLDAFDLESKFIYSKNDKTGADVFLPIHPVVHSVLNKWGGKLPPSMSYHTFNKKIKEVCKLAGINKMVRDINSDSGFIEKFKQVSTHICRRSMATNAYLSGMEPERLKHLTGHSSVQMLMRYINIDAKESANILRGLWE